MLNSVSALGSSSRPRATGLEATLDGVQLADRKELVVRGFNARGLSLIEMMVVLALLLALTSMAVPGFQSQWRTGRRIEALQEMVRVQQAQERWRASRGSYSADLGPAGLRISSAPGPSSSFDTAGKRYRLELGSVSASGYVLTATARSGSAQELDATCRVITLRVAGSQSLFTPPECAGS